MALAQAVVGEQRRAVGAQQRRGGLLAALQRAGHGEPEGDLLQPGGKGAGLGLTGLVETDAGGPAGQDAGGVRRCAAVTDQENCGHDVETSSPLRAGAAGHRAR